MEFDPSLLITTLLSLVLAIHARTCEEASDPSTPKARDSPLNCPYCKGVMAPGGSHGPTRRCGTCATRHHRECWGQHGGCSVFACPGGREARARRAAAQTSSGATSAPEEAEDSPGTEDLLPGLDPARAPALELALSPADQGASALLAGASEPCDPAGVALGAPGQEAGRNPAG